MIIIIGFILSFIGTLPPSLINLTVANTAVNEGYRNAWLMALGAVIVEFVQTFTALKLTELLSLHQEFNQYFQWISLAVFFGLAMMFLSKYFKTNSADNLRADERNLNPFIKGILISSVNVMIFPFWVFYGTWLSSQGYLTYDNWTIFIFSLASTVGTFIAFVGYAWLASYLLKHVNDAARKSNLVVGIIFIIMGIFQAKKIFFK